MKNLAKNLRNHPTDAERHVWFYLRKKQLSGYKFRRQEVLGDYIVDFVCFDAKLIIEVDGSQHIEQKDSDELRTAYLNRLGYKLNNCSKMVSSYPMTLNKDLSLRGLFFRPRQSRVKCTIDGDCFVAIAPRKDSL